MAKVLVLLSVFLLWAPALFSNETEDKKRELARLKSQAAQKENELKKYREAEKQISREISDLESRRREAERKKNKVEADISYIEQSLLSTADKRAVLKKSMPLWQRVVLAELDAYYFTPRCYDCPGGYSLEEDIFVDRMITHKAAFTAAMDKEQRLTDKQILTYEAKNKQLQERSSKLEEEQGVITTRFRKKKSALDVTKRKAEEVRKEINELNRSAEALNNLLAKFERTRKAQDAKASAQKTAGAKKSASGGPKIDAALHSLPWPVNGKVISKFGKEYRADLNTWIFRDGIKIAAQRGQEVRAAEEGSVIYAGPFRSYGNVVILDHGKGFFSIYGFLQDIKAAVGDKLPRQGVVGSAGPDTQTSSGTGRYAVYFEIRQGTVAVDPLAWLK